MGRIESGMKVGGYLWSGREGKAPALLTVRLLNSFFFFTFFGDRYYYYVVNALFLSIPLSLSDPIILYN